MDEKLVKSTIIAALLLFSLGGLFGYYLPREPIIIIETEVIEEIIEVTIEYEIKVPDVIIPIQITELLITTDSANLDNFSFNNITVIPDNTTWYEYFWNVYTINETVPEPNFTDNSFLILKQYRAGIENDTTIQCSIYRHLFAMGGHWNITIDRFVIISSVRNGDKIETNQSHSYYNMSSDYATVNSTNIIIVAFFGQCNDLNNIMLWYWWPIIEITVIEIKNVYVNEGG